MRLLQLIFLMIIVVSCPVIDPGYDYGQAAWIEDVAIESIGVQKIVFICSIVGGTACYKHQSFEIQYTDSAKIISALARVYQGPDCCFVENYYDEPCTVSVENEGLHRFMFTGLDESLDTTILVEWE